MTLSTPAQQGIDPLKFRQTLGHYPTGVVVVTGIADTGTPVAMVVGSFTSVSLDPPLVAFLPIRSSKTFELLRTAPSFCINVLADDQEDLCRRLARSDPDRFATVHWTPAPSGAPIIDGVVAAIDCTFDSVLEGGDHLIVLGAVTDLQIVNPTAPLLFFQGGYGSFTPLSLVARAGAGSELVGGVRLAELARHEMEAIAADFEAECTAYVAIGDEVAIVASAAAPGVPTLAQLGVRFPLMPPLGELFIAWASPEIADRWLARASHTADEALTERLRDRLEMVRQEGWAVSLAGATEDDHLAESLRTYSTGKVTPARLIEIQTHIRKAIDRYLHEPLEDDRQYQVGSLVVPVKDGNGRVVLVLRVGQLPAATGAQIRAGADRLLAAAARVENLIAEHAASLAK